MVRGFLSFTLLLSWAAVSPLQGSNPVRESAWKELVRREPGIVDDAGVSWLDRLALHVLTPEQGRAYLKGAKPEGLALKDGRTLAEYLRQRLNPPAGVFVALPGGCELFAAEELPGGEERAIRAREACGIPEEATAMLVTLRAESPGALRVKLWAVDLPEPAEAVWESSGFGEQAQTATVVVGLCEQDACPEGDLAVRVTESAILRGQAVGYFRALRVDDTPGRVLPMLLESTAGTTNDFFGYQAGGNTVAGADFNAFFGYQAGYGGTPATNNTGDLNSYFGYKAGYSNTNGSRNTFFGAWSGTDNTSANDNSFFGHDAGSSNSTGISNTFIGASAGRNNNASFNTFVGTGAGQDNTGNGTASGTRNTFVGADSGRNNITGKDNTFVGYQAGRVNTESSSNTFVGSNAGYSSTGSENSHFGHRAGDNSSTGSLNVFLGYSAGLGATPALKNSGSFNSFVGGQSGYLNTSGSTNAFFGYQAGYANTTGTANTFIGALAGTSNTMGNQNVFVGGNAGLSGSSASEGTYLGFSAGYSISVESKNTFVGYHADLDPGADPGRDPVTNSTAVGHRAYVSQSNSLILGSIAGVNAATNNVNVGIGITAPSAPLHVRRSDGTARVLVQETGPLAQRKLFELINTGGPRFELTNSATSTTWFFGVNAADQFQFSLLGSGGAEFLIAKDGSVLMGPGASFVFNLSPSGNLTIAGTMTADNYLYSSDRNLKEAVEAVDVSQVLSLVGQLPISTWRFQDDDTRHMGPMAQDFHAAFGLGEDDRHLSPTDTAGVALAAIQGLYRKLQENEAKIQGQEQQIELLKTRLSAIEARLVSR